MLISTIHNLALKCRSTSASLAPRTPSFLFFSSVQYDTRRQKSGEVQGRPGNTYHMNYVWWTRGGHVGGGGGRALCCHDVLDFIVSVLMIARMPDVHKIDSN